APARDAPTGQRGGHVVGVSLEPCRRRKHLATSRAQRLVALHGRGEDAGDARRAGEAETSAARKAAPNGERACSARVPEGAHCRMRLGRGVGAAGFDLEVRVERDGHRVERGTEVRRRGRHPHTPTCTHESSPAPLTESNAPLGCRELTRSPGYLLIVARLCARPGCNAAAAATFTFDPDELIVWLDAPTSGGARAGE